MSKARCASATIVLAIVCGALPAACGSTPGNAGTATGSGNVAGVRFSACIRAHGVPNFPDPGGSFPPGLKHSPAFQSAMQTCLRLEPPATSTGKQFTEAQRSAALAQARCIRDYGIPNFPDPTFPSSGGELFPAIPGVGPQSPAFKHAAAACGVTGPIGQPRGG